MVSRGAVAALLVACVLVCGCQFGSSDATFEQIKTLSRANFERVEPGASPPPRVARDDAILALGRHHADNGQLIAAQRVLVHDPVKGDRTGWLVAIRQAHQDCPHFDSAWGHVQYAGTIVDDQTGEELADFSLGCPPPGAAPSPPG